MKQRIYRYDNIKALLIFLVVLGHMTTDYVSDSHLIRWTTLWIYTFHMPAFIFLSGLVHKQYITEERAALGIRGETRLRLDKVLGFFLCGYGLKVFLQFTRTLMGQNPLWHWIEEPGIPWYLFVMAEYELLFYLMRRIDAKAKPWMMITGAFALSAVIGYFPAVGDAFCLSRMINFLPIYMIGYYLDMKEFNEFFEGRRWLKTAGCTGIIVSMAVCCHGKWGMYSWRKWFTGRRSYEFLQDFFSYAYSNGWWIRLAVWAAAIAITLSVIAAIPDKDLGFITTVGSRTLNVYFWHRPVCYLFRNWEVLPKLFMLFGGTYNAAAAGQAKGLAFTGGTGIPIIAAYVVYILIAAAMTAFFSLKVFEHPCSDLMKFAAKLTGKKA
ncbi:MAG: acyltransferase family protein [Mogibacterium sp.]|nr:acyltransferase family protein [Mogibacterium sp.]